MAFFCFVYYQYPRIWLCYFTHTLIYTYTHPYIHTYIHTYLYKYIHAYIHAFTHTAIKPYYQQPDNRTCIHVIHTYTKPSIMTLINCIFFLVQYAKSSCLFSITSAVPHFSLRIFPSGMFLLLYFHVLHNTSLISTPLYWFVSVCVCGGGGSGKKHRSSKLRIPSGNCVPDMYVIIVILVIYCRQL